MTAGQAAWAESGVAALLVLLSLRILCTPRRFHAAKRMLAALIQKLNAES
jgi:hypothetical protein